MPEVTIVIGGRNFEVACREGEEHFLASAAAMLDEEARTLQDSIGRVPESRMLLMSGLMLADKTAALEEQVSSASGSAKPEPQRNLSTGTDEGEVLQLKSEIAQLKASLAEAEAKLAQSAAELSEKDAAVGAAKAKAAEASEARDAAFAALHRMVERVETAAEAIKKAG
jgi:cell division protein ZapA